MIRDKSAPWTPTTFQRAILSEQHAVYSTEPYSSFKWKEQANQISTWRGEFNWEKGNRSHADLMECTGQLHFAFDFVHQKVAFLTLHFHSEFSAAKNRKTKINSNAWACCVDLWRHTSEFITFPNCF